MVQSSEIYVVSIYIPQPVLVLCHEESDDVIRGFLSLVLKLPTSFLPQEDSSKINQSLKTVDHFHRIFSFLNNVQSSLEG